MSDSSVEERIAQVRQARWIGYPLAHQTLERLERLFIEPKRHRMPNLLIVGDTNNGKSMIVNRFATQHPAEINPTGEHGSYPVVLVQTPPVPDEGRFYNAILNQLYAPFRVSARIDQRQFQVVGLLRLLEVRVLILDEIHHVLAGTLLKQRHFLNVIKYLGNELQIPIVGVGTRDAFNAIHSDPQLANRFQPAWLPRWSMNTAAERDVYRRLLASFESRLPLKEPSNLSESSMSMKILAVSEGTIGEIADLITEAAVYALQRGKEQITSAIIDRCGFTPPSRRRHAG